MKHGYNSETKCQLLGSTTNRFFDNLAISCSSYYDRSITNRSDLPSPTPTAFCHSFEDKSWAPGFKQLWCPHNLCSRGNATWRITQPHNSYTLSLSIKSFRSSTDEHCLPPVSAARRSASIRESNKNSHQLATHSSQPTTCIWTSATDYQTHT